MDAIFGIYFMLISVWAVGLMIHDKNASMAGKWRVSERQLLLTALFGGSLAIWAMMYVLRHKIRKPKFKYGIPAILAAQLVLRNFI